MRAIGKRGLDGRACMQRAKDLDRADGLARQLRRNVSRNRGQSENLYGQHLARSTHALEVIPAVVPQAKVQLLSCDGLLQRQIVAVEQAPNCRPDCVGAIRIKALSDQKVDVA